ncbi:MAG: hypothetical protein LBK56_11975 [Gracilibacteraceae bacterium]|jgi:hypothetical protein|nr:hypothetical protein [Gracilibacteraceae bacterium]
MLTLGRPISLTAAADAVILPASFGEKIKANYAIMAAAFTPKELLFLLVNPPEAPYTGGDVFNFAVERSDRSTLNMAVDIVNNIVNRVLLEDKSTATYQDSVYIDMALRKLGIENVALFMEQARALRSETLNTRELIRLYQENPPVRRGSPAAEAEARRPAAEKAGGAAEDAPAARREYYLHNEIFRRLDTARIIASLARFAHSSVENYTRLGEREMLLAEYERSALTLTLNEYRRQTGFLTGGDIFYHRNHYELGDILPAPAGEKEVLEQATAAALLQLIDSALNCRTENYLSAREQWLDLRIGLYQTAQNSLRRFISFHEESAGRAVAGGGAAALPALALLTELEAITLARQPQGGPPPPKAAAVPPVAAPRGG